MPEFYEQLYGANAKIPTECFELWADRAQSYMEYFCSEIPETDAAKKCLCEIAELLYSADCRGNVAAETNDGYSVKFADTDVQKEIYKIIRRYFSADGALYWGDFIDTESD